MRYGNFDTLDTPCLVGQGAGITPSKEQIELEQRAREWLEKKFNEIDGNVWRKENPHDFGTYPSFEIDAPNWYCMADLNQDFEDDTTDLDGDKEKIDEWTDKANAIIAEYCKEFEKYL